MGLQPLIVFLYGLANNWVQMKPWVLTWKDSVGFKIRRSVQLAPRNGTKIWLHVPRFLCGRGFLLMCNMARLDQSMALSDTELAHICQVAWEGEVQLLDCAQRWLLVY